MNTSILGPKQTVQVSLANNNNSTVTINPSIEVAQKAISVTQRDTQVSLGHRINKDLEISNTAFFTAMNLMFDEFQLVKGTEEIPEAKRIPFVNSEEMAKRHEALKNAIAKIQPSHINASGGYILNNYIVISTLLLQAINYIKNPARRLEIITSLLEKGANPEIQGHEIFGDDNDDQFILNPLKEAKKLGDKQVVDLLEKSLHREIESGQLILQAFDLMLNQRRRNQGTQDLNFSPQELAERHENLKKVIAKILPEDLDYLVKTRDYICYFDGETTLLLQAIQNISDVERRFEIVKILLEKGADPTFPGSFGEYYVLPLIEAKKLGDQQLVNLIETARKKFIVEYRY